MSSDAEDTASASSSDADATQSAPDFAARIDRLTEKNRRLQSEHVHGRQTADRRIALGFFGVGVLVVLGAVVFPESRNILFALGGTGLFAGFMTYYFTPEQYIDADVGRRVYAASAETGEELVDELGLQKSRVYAPARTDAEAFASVRLFVPQHTDYAVPNPDQLGSLFVESDGRDAGVSVPPSGGSLYREFEQLMAETVADQPSSLAAQLVDALVEGFELVESATPDAEDGCVSVEIEGSVYGPLDRFDHPVPSFLAVGLAAEFDVPVTAEVTTAESSHADYLVTCRWDDSAVADAE